MHTLRRSLITQCYWMSVFNQFITLTLFIHIVMFIYLLIVIFYIMYCSILFTYLYYAINTMLVHVFTNYINVIILIYYFKLYLYASLIYCTFNLDVSTKNNRIPQKNCNVNYIEYVCWNNKPVYIVFVLPSIRYSYRGQYAQL